MNTVQLVSVESLNGFVLGASANPDRSCPIQIKGASNYAASGTTGQPGFVNQIVDRATEIFTIATAATLDVSLLAGGGEIDPLGDPAAFTKVREFYLEHSPTSLAVDGIKLALAATSAFVGPISGTSSAVTLLPGEVYHVKTASSAGWTVNSTQKVVRLINLDTTASHVASYRLFVAGS